MGIEMLEEQIISYVKDKGPCLPVKVAKMIDKSILMTSAILSGMTSSGKLLKTFKKIGDSHLYYVPEQEEQVKQGVVKSMDDIEMSAFKELKEKKLFHDKDLNPRERVFVRKFRDFFRPTDNNGDLIWNYYTVQEETIKEFINKAPKQVLDTGKTRVLSEPVLNIESLPEPILKEEPLKKIEEKPKKELPPLKLDFKSLETRPVLKTFFQRVKHYFESKNIVVRDSNIVKKNKEVNLTAVLESSLGKQVYFVKAIDKKRVSESDLALAWTESSGKGMPCIFLMTGKLTKSGAKFYKENLKNLVLIKEL